MSGKTVEDIHHHQVQLLDPRGELHMVGNIQEFVETNWHLFESDEDVIHRFAPKHRGSRGYWTRADRGLARMVRDGTPWKGWSLA